MRNVRIRFSKSGQAIYISHLDINRLMARAVRRADLPMWYTQGFNPHPYIAFALPLSLGQKSDCEYMDIKIQGDMNNDEVYNRLSAVMPSGIGIEAVADPVHSSNEIVAAKYEITLDFLNEKQALSFAKKAKELMAGGQLIAEKMGKKGRKKVLKQINLIDQIFEKEVAQLDCSVVLKLTLAAGNTLNLNPSLLIETIEKLAEIESDQQHIVRKDLLITNAESFC